MGILTYNRDTFLMDGKPYTILSGAMHYFRIPREYWYDRLLKLKECGFNTVETYTPWNLHEPTEGTFDFTGNLDIFSAPNLSLAVCPRGYWPTKICSCAVTTRFSFPGCAGIIPSF